MILTPSELQAMEDRALAGGASESALMEEAGAAMADVVRQFFPAAGRCVVFFGKGHNGGDALVAARHLARHGWKLDLRPAFEPESWSSLTAQKHRELVETRVRVPVTVWQETNRVTVVVDGLLGIGAGGELREPILSAAREINRLRTAENAHVFALDLPTGLDGDNGRADAHCVLADFTLTVAFAKAGLLADAATRFVGRLAVLPLAELSASAGTDRGASVATARSLAPLLPRRVFDRHKGDCGRVGIIAGSPGLTGAAVLCAEACVHAGAGLVTLYATPEIYPHIVSRIAPEVMVKPVESYLDALDAKHTVLAIGPGLGTAREADVFKLVQRAALPMVIDADALNLLARRTDLLMRCAGPRLLTPHPGEMARLDPGSANRPRHETVTAFTERFPITLLLKGARTVIGEAARPLSYNSTGHPGMATGGMGDVLTGVCAALAGQGLALYDAARLGAWLCGRAAELAVFDGPESAESLSARHVIARLGAACKSLRAGCW
ncbi:MAG: NAD(P)H-hydrate dehydratase [Chthoniobacter sp.]|nr:NAD(P)H-hydrate dehydratase [Chthoniobacter sp.]